MMAKSFWNHIALGCIAASLSLTGAAFAAGESAEIGVVSNIKVLSENPASKYKCEDVSSPEAWKKTYIKDGMTDEQKAIAIWQSVVKYRHQDNPPDEWVNSMGNVHDPIKTMNVYGYGMCCCASSNIEGLARYLGMPAQGRMITNHSVPEVWYDNAWHLLDSSLMSYFRNDKGALASVDQIMASINEWRKENPGKLDNESEAKAFSKNGGWKNGPKVLATVTTYDDNGINGAGYHGWWSNIFEYRFKILDKAFGVAPDGSKSLSVYDYGASMGYKVNVQLRDGEKITRNWSNKGLHANMHDKGDKVDFAVKNKGPDIIRDVGPLKFQRTLGDLAPGRVGNGTHEYDLPLASGAFKRGALVADNLVTKSEGGPLAVAVKDPSKDAVIVVRMPSSYLYLDGNITLSPVVGEGGSVTVLFSDNHGLDWKEIGKFDKTGDQEIKTEKNVFRRYDYQVKVVMHGAGTGLNALKISNDIQHSQAVLPLILEGDNKLSFSAGPQEGTVTYEGNMSGKETRNINFLAFHPELNGLDSELLRVGESGKGTATFTLKTPGDMTRIRFDAHYRARDLAGKDFYDVEVSFDQGKTWNKVERLDKAQPASSKYFTYDQVPAGTHEALVRFTGGQKNTVCMFDLRMDADYKEPAGGFRPVKVTYAWTENGQEKTDSHVCKTAEDTWTIKCGPKTVAKSYTVELAK